MPKPPDSESRYETFTKWYGAEQKVGVSGNRNLDVLGLGQPTVNCIHTMIGTNKGL